MPGGELPAVSSQAHTDAGGDAAGRVVGSATAAAPREYAALSSEVIHELRTPLTSIHGYAQVLQRTLRSEPRAANALAVVLRESTRLSSMLSALSELAELEANHERPLARVETEQVADDIIQKVMRRDAQAHPIELSGRGTACCNATCLSQALLHVLTNAVRYSDPGTPISVTISEAAESVTIEVADSGFGIDSADADRVYQAYERGAQARLTGIRGLGLGLFLTRKTLAQTGGSVQHERREEGGTVFRITLPRA